jgi:hypothetical protein
MTNLLTKDQLDEIAFATTRPVAPPARPVVTLRWTIDSRTGRPIGRWVVGDQPGAEGPSPAALG